MKIKDMINEILKYLLILCFAFMVITAFYIFAKNVETINEYRATDVYVPSMMTSLVFQAILYFCFGIGSLIGIALTGYSIYDSYVLRRKFKTIDDMEEKLTTTICKKCGSKIKINEKFCHNCGEENKIKNNIN